MKTLEQIKEEYAKELGYSSWNAIGYDANYSKRTDEVARRYATECAKESLRLASENATIVNRFGNDIGCYSFDINRNKIWINKQSILSESNLPKHK